MKPQDANEGAAEPTDTVTIHENVAFDILFEIEVNLDKETVLPMCKVLGILTVDPSQQNNIKQYKVLLDRIMGKITKKSALVHLKKFKETLKLADSKPDHSLPADELLKLEERRKEGVRQAEEQIKAFLQTQEPEEDEEAIPPTRVRKRKLQGRRRPMDTTEKGERKRKRKKVQPKEPASTEPNPDTLDFDATVEAQAKQSEKPKKVYAKKRGGSKQPKKPVVEPEAQEEESEEDEIDKFVRESAITKETADPALAALASDSDGD